MNPWIVKPRSAPPPRHRLFCFHCAGGSAQPYLNWNALFPPGIEVVGIQLPGRGARYREPLLTAIDAVQEALGPTLRQELDCPFSFFGHSLGAMLAFETARWLRRAGLPMPQHLTVACRAAPQCDSGYAGLHDFPEDQLLATLVRYGGVDPVLLANLDALRLFLPAIRADLRLNGEYVWHDEAPLDCPITAIGADRDAICDPERLAAWSEHTSGRFSSRQFEGNHFFFVKEPERYVQSMFPEIFAGLGTPASSASSGNR